MTERHARSVELTSSQCAALKHVNEIVSSRQAEARDRLARILRNAGCADDLLEQALECIRTHARIVLHFHPDRLCHKRISVAESLLEDGCYRNQFETGLSSGSRTAFPGGDRDQWEKELFGSAYHAVEVRADDRPKYGALELVRFADGPTPRFGSCYLVLRTSVSERTSFTFSGSEQALAAERLGTRDKMECVIAALLTEIEAGEGAKVPWPPFAASTLGIENLTVRGLLERVCRELPSSPPDPALRTAGRVLDSCVEAQVHGPIDLQRDVERLVIDPAFERTPTGEVLNEISRRSGIPIQWHCGFQLPAEAVPDDFRGPAMSKLARRIAPLGLLDAAVIGAAEATLHSQPELWDDWGSRDETLQHLKQLWHVLVRFGSPVRGIL